MLQVPQRVGILVVLIWGDGDLQGKHFAGDLSKRGLKGCFLGCLQTDLNNALLVGIDLQMQLTRHHQCRQEQAIAAWQDANFSM